MTGRRWSITRGRRGGCGGECQVSWSGRRRGRGFPDFSLNPSSNRCFSSVQRRGWLPPAWDGSWVFLRPCDAATETVSTLVESQRKVGVHLGGDGNKGVRVWDNRNLHPEKAEYVQAVYCDATNYVPIRGSGEEAGGMVGDVVLVTSGNWTGRGKGDDGGGDRGGQRWSG